MTNLKLQHLKIALLLVVASIVSACVTTNGESSSSLFGIKIVTNNETSSVEANEGLVHSALAKRLRDFSVSPGEENKAQHALSENEEYQYTSWNNDGLGELRIAPTSSYERNGQACRGYQVQFWYTGSTRARMHAPGTACKDSSGVWHPHS